MPAGWAAMPLEMLTIRPHPFAIIAGSSRKLRFATATTLTPIAAAHCARSMPGLAPRGATTAALLISTSTSPSWAPPPGGGGEPPRVADVGRDAPRLPAKLLRLARGLVQFVARAGHQCQLSTGPGQPQGDSAADATTGSRHQGGLTVHVVRGNRHNLLAPDRRQVLPASRGEHSAHPARAWRTEAASTASRHRTLSKVNCPGL